jgi:hypothetical protein
MAEKIGKNSDVDDDEDVLKAARLFLKKHVTAIHTEQNLKIFLPSWLTTANDVILLTKN